MDKPQLTKGTLFDLQGFSVHDGPGCRSLVFLKGCSLKCPWCSNPEGISPFPVLMWNEQKCTCDLFCQAACPHQAVSIPENMPVFDRRQCAICSSHDCLDACQTGALKLAGYATTTGEVYARLNRDRQYWGAEGGVTLTGGEPFLQPVFTAELLQRCYEAGMHTAVETCGYVPWENILPSVPYLDWIFFDLKHTDPSEIRKLSGRKINEPMEGCSDKGVPDPFSNARLLAKIFPGRMVFRMPVVPGYNDNPGIIDAIAQFLLETGRKEINLLPIHHLGRGKYTQLGLPYKFPQLPSVNAAALLSIAGRFETFGIQCYAGSDTPF